MRGEHHGLRIDIYKETYVEALFLFPDGDEEQPNRLAWLDFKCSWEVFFKHADKLIAEFFSEEMRNGKSE